MQTPEESALDLLFEVHGQLSYAMDQFDDLARAVEYERQLRAVEERSKKDTRMDRRQQDMLLVDETMRAESSASRSNSPGAIIGRPAEQPSHEVLRQSFEQLRVSPDHAPLAQAQAPAQAPIPIPAITASAPMSPIVGSAAGTPAPATVPSASAPPRAPSHANAAVAGAAGLAAVGAGVTVLTNGHGFPSDRSSTPSPEDHRLPQPPAAKPAARAPSPAGKGRRMGGPRPLPLPNAFRSHNSTASLQAASEVHASSLETAGTPAPDSSEELTDDAPPKLPTRKALGKRRADPDSEYEWGPDAAVILLQADVQTTLILTACSRAARSRRRTTSARRASRSMTCTRPSLSSTRTTRTRSSCCASARPRRRRLCRRGDRDIEFDGAASDLPRAQRRPLPITGARTHRTHL